jgi:hypothetical protein
METEDFERQLFELNMKTCEKCRPSLFEKIKAKADSGRYIIFPSEHESGAYNMLDSTEEKLYYELEDPIGSIASHLETCINRLQGIMVCLGFGIGYAPLMLEKQKNFVSRSIVVIEPDLEVILKAFSALDCRSIIESKDVLMCVDFTVDEIGIALQDHLFQDNRLINAKNVQIVDMPASLSVHRDYYLKAMKRVNSTVYEGVKFVGNCPNDALQGLDNTLANLERHLALPGIAELGGIFAGKPGIVVASGPSLDKNVHLLKGLENKAVIVSADASLRHLIRRKLKPHFIACMERLDETALLFKGLHEKDYEDVHMVASPVVHPDSFAAYKGQILATEREYLYFQSFDFGKGQLVPGPSAGNMAFRLLKYLGCSPIVLIGQDLALNEEGKTHATGDPYGDEQSVYLDNPEEIEGNYTETLKTNPILKMFHYGYQIDVANFEGTVINATEGGAKIPGTEVMSFQEAIETHIQLPIDLPAAEPQTISDYIANHLRFPTENQISKSRAKAQRKIENALKGLDAADKKIKRAQKAAASFEKYVGETSDFDDKKSRQRDRVLQAMNQVSALTSDKRFARIALDVVSAVFFHTMVEYVSATANAETEEEQDLELIHNVTNLTNNFTVLLKFVRKLYSEHLLRLSDENAELNSETIFNRETNDFSITEDNGANVISLEASTNHDHQQLEGQGYA